jgi:hypothetical protein
MTAKQRRHERRTAERRRLKHTPHRTHLSDANYFLHQTVRCLKQLRKSAGDYRIDRVCEDLEAACREAARDLTEIQRTT